GDARADFMTRLGFTIPTAITEKATGNFYIPVANENLNLFDADLTVLFPIFLDSSAFANDPLLRAIPSAQQGHLLILDDPALVNAFSSGSVPGLTYAIDNAVPKFASTLGA
ncbi:MAG: iron-siderophore ABC transporter substrate-binding protein, partial [Rhodococcus sp. (in: high G+C Gram-positive bacteria)]